MSERVLREQDLTLERTLEICRAAELSATQSKTMSERQSLQVNAVTSKSCISKGSRGPRQSENKMPAQAPQHKNTVDCKYCGKRHERKKEACPAWGQEMFWVSSYEPLQSDVSVKDPNRTRNFR